MSAKLCPACDAPLPKGARFCPRCGRSAGGAAGGRPMGSGRAPFPLAGIMFLLFLIAGPTLLILGIVFANPALLYAGTAVTAAVALFLVLGMFF